MIRPYLILLCMLLVTALPDAQARIWRVNNQEAMGADFTYLSAAYSAAAAGDTLHIESLSAYEYLPSFTKKLMILGPGYFLEENPQTRAATQSVQLYGSIIFEPGSEGSVLMGLNFQGSSVYIRTGGIT